MGGRGESSSVGKGVSSGKSGSAGTQRQLDKINELARGTGGIDTSSHVKITGRQRKAADGLTYAKGTYDILMGGSADVEKPK